MWKYVVTWCIVVMTSVPKSAPPDEFGREGNSFWYETEISNDCGHERWFNDRKEAFAFHQRAMNETTRWFTTLNGDSVSFPQAGQLDKVKIDSVWYGTEERLDQQIIERIKKLPDSCHTIGPIFLMDSAVYIERQFHFDSIKIEW